MARADYVYLVKKRSPSQHVIGAFTVKHEMITSIERNLSEYEPIALWRYPDGMCNVAVFVADGSVKDVLEIIR